MPLNEKQYQRFLKMWAAGTGRPRPPSNVIDLAAARRAREQKACDCERCRRPEDAELKSA